MGAAVEAPAKSSLPTNDARTIWSRRAEVGLRAPDAELRGAVWDRVRLISISNGTAGYDPWPSFAKAHNSPATFVLCSGAERVGKSIATAMEALAWLPVSRLIWIVGPQYRDTLKEFDYIAEACLNMRVTTKRRIHSQDKGPSKIEVIDPAKKGKPTVCRIETRSLWDIERSLVAEAPDLVLVVEAGLVQRDPIEKLRMRVSTRRGRVWLSGTLEDASPWFTSAYERWQSWPNGELAYSINVPLYENEQDFPGGEENPEIQTMRQTMRPATYSHRVVGRPAPSELLVFNRTFHRGTIPFCAQPRRMIRFDANDQRVPVYVTIDPGWKPSHYAVHFLQDQGDEICVIGEVVGQQMTHEEMAHEALRHPCWDNVVSGIIDPWAAKQHGMGNARTAFDVWQEEAGLVNLRMPEPAPHPVQIIDRFWFYLRHPNNGRCRFFFDPQSCPHLLYEWQHWKYQRDEEGRPMRMEPQKRHCDAIKGIGYFLVERYNAQRFVRDQSWGRKAKVSPWRFR